MWEPVNFSLPTAPQPLVAEGHRLLAVEAAIERVQLRSFEHTQHLRPVRDPLHADAPAVARHHALHERRAVDQGVLLPQMLHHHAARLQDRIAFDQPADEQVAVHGDAPAQFLDVVQGLGAVTQAAELRRGELQLLALKLDQHGRRPHTVTTPVVDQPGGVSSAEMSEHALLIVKPDGVRHPRFMGILDQRLAELSLRQVATRELRMSREQARTFWREGDVEEYVAYLREGPSRAVLVRGRQATRQCRLLKSELRKELNCRSYRNLIHSTEPGNEYEEQFRRLFPELQIEEHGIFDQIALVTPDRAVAFLSRATDPGTPRLTPVVPADHVTDRGRQLAAWLESTEAVPYAGVRISGVTWLRHDDIRVIMYLGRNSDLDLPHGVSS